MISTSAVITGTSTLGVIHRRRASRVSLAARNRRPVSLSWASRPSMCRTAFSSLSPLNRKSVPCALSLHSFAARSTWRSAVRCRDSFTIQPAVSGSFDPSRRHCRAIASCEMSISGDRPSPDVVTTRKPSPSKASTTERSVWAGTPVAATIRSNSRRAAHDVAVLGHLGDATKQLLRCRLLFGRQRCVDLLGVIVEKLAEAARGPESGVRSAARTGRDWPTCASAHPGAPATRRRCARLRRRDGWRAPP